ncbi:hypothetical protein CsSME_00014242 [Camellia sinensis var. sinensis]
MTYRFISDPTPNLPTYGMLPRVRPRSTVSSPYPVFSTSTHHVTRRVSSPMSLHLTLRDRPFLLSTIPLGQHHGRPSSRSALPLGQTSRSALLTVSLPALPTTAVGPPCCRPSHSANTAVGPPRGQPSRSTKRRCRPSSRSDLPLGQPPQSALLGDPLTLSKVSYSIGFRRGEQVGRDSEMIAKGYKRTLKTRKRLSGGLDHLGLGLKSLDQFAPFTRINFKFLKIGSSLERNFSCSSGLQNFEKTSESSHFTLKHNFWLLEPRFKNRHGRSSLVFLTRVEAHACKNTGSMNFTLEPTFGCSSESAKQRLKM